MNGQIYLFALMSREDEISAAQIARFALRRKVIGTYTLIPDSGFVFSSIYGRYFLTEQFKRFVKEGNFIFIPLQFGEFGGNLPTSTWDDFEKTFDGSIDQLVNAHDAATDRKELDEAIFAGQFDD
jgi:hypothetical protein